MMNFQSHTPSSNPLNQLPGVAGNGYILPPDGYILVTAGFQKAENPPASKTRFIHQLEITICDLKPITEI